MFSGIAGNMTDKIGVGDVCLSKEVVYHDAEITMIDQHYPYLDSYKGDENLIKAAGRACEETNTKYIVGKIATGDKFVGDTRTKNAIKASCDPDCVEMEGAAIAHIACKNDIPFLIIRAMSDNADEQATETLVVKHFDAAEYCDKAADICELTVILLIKILNINIKPHRKMRFCFIIYSMCKDKGHAKAQPLPCIYLLSFDVRDCTLIICKCKHCLAVFFFYCIFSVACFTI